MVELNEDLSYEEYPMAVVDRQVRQLRTKDIPMVKVLWSNHSEEDCTWEAEAEMRKAYPYLFPWIVVHFFFFFIVKFEDEFL